MRPLSLFSSSFSLSLLSLSLLFTLLSTSHVEAASFNDPQYETSWHLRPTSDVNDFHLNVESVWDSGVTGKGVMIAFSSRTPFLHNEFTHRFAADASSISLSDTPSSSKTSHIALAVGNANNNVCSVGVAYEASFNVINTSPENALHFKWMTEYKTSLAQVLVVDYTGQDGTNTHCTECWDAVHMATTRNQAVVIATGTGGAGEDCNRDMYSNSPLTIAVAPHTSAGVPSVYAEKCANALVSAPGGSSTRPLLTAINGTDFCGGVSSGLLPAPLVAGVVALMLEASSNALTHRQIAHILVETAVVPEKKDSEWIVNGAGLNVHPVMGFGMVDADRAVKAAAKRIPYTEVASHQVISHNVFGLPQDLPDIGKVELSAPINENSEILVDWVAVQADIDHNHAGDLEILLTSPLGTQSVLYSVHNTEEDVGQIILEFNTTSTHTLGTHPITPLNKVAHKPKAIGQVRLHLLDCCSQKYCSVTKDKGNTPMALVISHKDKKCTTQVAVSTAVNAALYYQLPVSIVILDEVINADSLGISVPVVALDTHSFAGIYTKSQEGKHYLLSLRKQVSKGRVNLKQWMFSTTRNWGEHAQGTWHLSIEDKIAGDSGRVNSVTFVFHTYTSGSPTTPTYRPPSSAPRPTHRPSHTPPTHTPSRVPAPKSNRNCCVYLSSTDYVTKNCVSFNMDCPELDDWILSSVEAGVDNCRSRCFAPSPSPTPVKVAAPTPKGGVNFQCCWYLSSDQKKYCYRFAVDVCPNIPNMTPVGEFPSATLMDCNEFCEQ